MYKPSDPGTALVSAVVDVVNNERVKQGVSVAALARRAGMPRSTVQYKLKGRGSLYLDDLAAWARALGFVDFNGYDKIVAWMSEAKSRVDAA